MRRIKPKMCGNHCTKIEHVDVTLDNNHILEDVNFHLYCGEMLTIIGKNGAGKSTLMKALLGEIPYKGRIILRICAAAGGAGLKSVMYRSTWLLIKTRPPRCMISLHPVSAVVRCGL